MIPLFQLDNSTQRLICERRLQPGIDWHPCMPPGHTTSPDTFTCHRSTRSSAFLRGRSYRHVESIELYVDRRWMQREAVVTSLFPGLLLPFTGRRRQARVTAHDLSARPPSRRTARQPARHAGGVRWGHGMASHAMQSEVCRQVTAVHSLADWLPITTISS